MRQKLGKDWERGRDKSGEGLGTRLEHDGFFVFSPHDCAIPGEGAEANFPKRGLKPQDFKGFFLGDWWESAKERGMVTRVKGVAMGGARVCRYIITWR